MPSLRPATCAAMVDASLPTYDASPCYSVGAASLTAILLIA